MCVCTFTREEKISIIKIACFTLNFLNLKSKARHLFFWVASSLSILWTRYVSRLGLKCLDLLLFKNWYSIHLIFQSYPGCHLRRLLPPQPCHKFVFFFDFWIGRLQLFLVRIRQTYQNSNLQVVFGKPNEKGLSC